MPTQMKESFLSEQLDLRNSGFFVVVVFLGGGSVTEEIELENI